MKNIEAAIIAKAHPKFDRKKINPGSYHVDFFLHVIGQLTVGENYEVPATADLSIYGVLVTVLLESGVKPNKILPIIERTAKRALERKTKFNEQLSKQAQELLENIKKRFGEKLPRKEISGAIRLDELEIKKVIRV